MTQETFKCSCGYACESKYALKKHSRFCQLGRQPSAGNLIPVKAVPFNGPRGTFAKRQGFTEPYVKPMTADSVSAALHPLRRDR